MELIGDVERGVVTAIKLDDGTVVSGQPEVDELLSHVETMLALFDEQHDDYDEKSTLYDYARDVFDCVEQHGLYVLPDDEDDEEDEPDCDEYEPDYDEPHIKPHDPTVYVMEEYGLDPEEWERDLDVLMPETTPKAARPAPDFYPPTAVQEAPGYRCLAGAI